MWSIHIGVILLVLLCLMTAIMHTAVAVATLVTHMETDNGAKMFITSTVTAWLALAAAFILIGVNQII